MKTTNSNHSLYNHAIIQTKAGICYLKQNHNALFILLQLFALTIMALIFAFINGWLGFKSVILGGSAWIIPNLYFICKMQQKKIAYKHYELLKVFFLYEAIKLLLSFSIILLILALFTINKLGFLSGYVIIILTSFLMPQWYGVKK